MQRQLHEISQLLRLPPVSFDEATLLSFCYRYVKRGSYLPSVETEESGLFKELKVLTKKDIKQYGHIRSLIETDIKKTNSSSPMVREHHYMTILRIDENILRFYMGLLHSPLVLNSESGKKFAKGLMVIQQGIEDVVEKAANDYKTIVEDTKAREYLQNNGRFSEKDIKVLLSYNVDPDEVLAYDSHFAAEDIVFFIKKEKELFERYNI
jgi:hypothetical protein